MTSSEPRILYLFPGTLEPATCGMRQRNQLLYRALCEIGRVDTICCREKYEPVSDEALDEMRRSINLVDVFDLPERGEHFPWSVVRPISEYRIDRLARAFGCPDVENRAVPRLKEMLDRHVANDRYDLVVGRYLYRGGKAGVLSIHPNAIDIDDLQTEMLRTTLETSRGQGVSGQLQRRRLNRLTSKLPDRMKNCDVLWVANDEHIGEPGLEDAIYLPNIPFFESDDIPEPPQATASDNKTLLFVGSFGHLPNVEGIRQFLKRVWPEIRQSVPDAKINLVGSKMSSRLKQEFGQIGGVEPLGFVDDIRDAYASAALSVVPIYRGSGTNIKVPESLSYARPCVITPFAQRGFRTLLSDHAGCRVADDDAQFSALCIDLLNDSEKRNRAGKSSYALVRQRLSFRAFSDIVAQSLRPCLSASWTSTHH